MSAGIYMYNGLLAYAMDLDKKLKRRKGAVIIEEYKGENPTEAELQKLLDKHNKIVKQSEPKEDLPLKYRFKNKNNNKEIVSIYPHLNNIPNINKEEWCLVS